MNYEEALEFLQSRIKFGIRPGTERTAAVMDVLAEPQRTYPVLHIAGTNAKFSVLAIATSILSELGLSVGTYVSPDLGNVRERIGFAAEGGILPIDEETFASTIEYLQPYIELVEARLGEQLTYFELLTVVAFEAFFDRAVHAAVVEAGLGGEYDATNVADAAVGVLTNVSLDHIRQFGGDLAKAAWEKAGIAKEGTVLITGVEQDDLFDLIAKRADEKGAKKVLRAARDIDLVERHAAVGGQLLTIRTEHTTYDDVFLALFGEHQAHNAVLAVSAVEAFIASPIDGNALELGLANVTTPGRLEVLLRHPLVLADGGHNPASAEQVRATVESSFAKERLILVVGMLNEKLIDEVLEIWAPIVDHAIVTAPKSGRAAEPERLADVLRSNGISDDSLEVIPDVAAAVDHAIGMASDDDLVLVYGSFYTVGEARDFLRSGRSLT